MVNYKEHDIVLLLYHVKHTIGTNTVTVLAYMAITFNAGIRQRLILMHVL